MLSQDYDGFKKLLERAATVTFQQRGKDWDALVTVMFEELAQYDLETIRAAVRDHVRSEKFFPALADIVCRIEGRPEDRAAAAWGMVLRAVSRFGHDTSVRFPSPAIHYALEQMGGWARFCMRLVEAELPFRAKDFAQFFAMGERCTSWDGANGTVKVPAYLAGTCELSNRANGHILPARVYDVETGKVLEGLALPAPKGEVVPIMAALAGRMRAGGEKR